MIENAGIGFLLLLWVFAAWFLAKAITKRSFPIPRGKLQGVRFLFWYTATVPLSGLVVAAPPLLFAFGAGSGAGETPGFVEASAIVAGLVCASFAWILPWVVQSKSAERMLREQQA